jgi:hypothetical protein
MIIPLFKYLIESSLCLLLFIAGYRFLISNLTHFSWMRFYLISSLVLSLIVPVIPIQWETTLVPAGSLTDLLPAFIDHTINTPLNNAITDPTRIHSGFSMSLLVIYGLLILYLLGAIYKGYLLARNLKKIMGVIKTNRKVKEANYWIVSLNGQIPAFSFFNYIFINEGFKDLSEKELRIIKEHEKIHVDHYHTFDLLFLEVVRVLFWFNPSLNYLKRSLQEIHEYIADEKVAGEGESKQSYALLLLNLASENKVFDLVAGFTGEHIKRRILMIAKPRNSAKYKLRFFALVPITLILLVIFSCSKDPGTMSNWADQCPTCKKLELKQYSGIYLPAKKDTMLRPMEILNSSNRLFRFIETDPFTPNRTIELQFIADNRFSYTDNSSRSIEFIVNDKNEVTGCFLIRRDGTFHLLKQK